MFMQNESARIRENLELSAMTSAQTTLYITIKTLLNSFKIVITITSLGRRCYSANNFRSTAQSQSRLRHEIKVHL